METIFVNVSSVLDRIFQNHGVLILQAFLVVFGSAVIDFVQRRLLNRLAIQLAKTKTPWDDAFLDSVRRPLSILIWVVGITFSAQIVARISPQYSIISDAVGPLRNVAIIGLCAWFLIRFIGHAANNVIATRREAGRTAMADAAGEDQGVALVVLMTRIANEKLTFAINQELWRIGAMTDMPAQASSSLETMKLDQRFDGALGFQSNVYNPKNSAPRWSVRKMVAVFRSMKRYSQISSEAFFANYPATIRSQTRGQIDAHKIITVRSEIISCSRGA